MKSPKEKDQSISYSNLTSTNLQINTSVSGTVQKDLTLENKILRLETQMLALKKKTEVLEESNKSLTIKVEELTQEKFSVVLVIYIKSFFFYPH